MGLLVWAVNTSITSASPIAVQVIAMAADCVVGDLDWSWTPGSGA
jgi:hypothetical protein